jgi:hypothetical protein
MTIREWSPLRGEPSDLVWFCDRCNAPFRAADRNWTSCGKCASFDRIAVAVMPPAAVLAAAKHARRANGYRAA